MPGTDFAEATAAVRQLLVAHGPLSCQALLDELAQPGVDLGADREALLAEVLVQDDAAFVALPDGRWAWTPALLDGRIFTCRLGGAEAAGDFIGLGPELRTVYPLGQLPEFRDTDRSQTGVLVDGTAMRAALAERGVDSATIAQSAVVLFPPGRFNDVGVRAGDLAGVRVTAHVRLAGA